MSTRDEFIGASTGCVLSSQLVYTGWDFTKLCRAKVGKLQTKWCFSTDCTIKSHTSGTRFNLSDATGLYVRCGASSSTLAHVSPFIPAKKVHGQLYAKEMFEVSSPISLLKWSSWFSVINNGDLDDSFNLELIKSTEFELLKRSADFQTPKAKKSPYSMDFQDKEEKDETFGGDDDLSLDPTHKCNPIIDVGAMRDDITILLEKIRGSNSNSDFLEPITEALELFRDYVSQLGTDSVALSHIEALEKEVKVSGGHLFSSMAKIVNLSSLVGEAPKNTLMTTVVGGLSEVQDDVQATVSRISNLEADLNKFRALIGKTDIATSEEVKKYYAAQKKGVYAALKKIVEHQTDLYNQLAEVQAGVAKDHGFFDTPAKETEDYEDLFKNPMKGDSPRLVYDAKSSSVGAPPSKSGLKRKVLDCVNCDCQCEKRLCTLEDSVVDVQTKIASFKGGRHSKENEIVSIGGLLFASMKHLEEWCKKHLPPSIPFGCFVDPDSLMDRVIDDGALMGLSMVERFKMAVSADDAINLDSFNRRVPKLFDLALGVAGLKTSSTSYLLDFLLQNHGKIRVPEWESRTNSR